LRLGALGYFDKQSLANGFLLFQVGGVHADSLVGHVEAGQPQIKPHGHGFVKVAIVKMSPSLQQLGVLG